ncbi:MAG: hypothetical protein OET18_13225, partial [Desulfobacterales bacterium]|nr:hypothetical protein [Desulfobacterales bacterium]
RVTRLLLLTALARMHSVPSLQTSVDLHMRRCLQPLRAFNGIVQPHQLQKLSAPEISLVKDQFDS